MKFMTALSLIVSFMCAEFNLVYLSLNLCGVGNHSLWVVDLIALVICSVCFAINLKIAVSSLRDGE